MSRVPLLTAIGLAAVVTLGSLTAAAAATADATPSEGAPSTQLTPACARVPARIARLEMAQTRLRAGAETRGSIAFLQTRIDRANAGGDADRARLLAERMAVRKEIDSSLTIMLTRLRNAQAICADHPASAAPSS